MAKTNPTNIQSAKWKIQTRGQKQQGVTLTGEELRAIADINLIAINSRFMEKLLREKPSLH